MSYSLRIKGFFFGCFIGVTLAARLALLPLSLFETMVGLADYANELSILTALFAAPRLTERLKSHRAKRAVLHVLEQGWVTWTAQLEASKSAVPVPSVATLKQVA